MLKLQHAVDISRQSKVNHGAFVGINKINRVTHEISVTIRREMHGLNDLKAKNRCLALVIHYLRNLIRFSREIRQRNTKQLFFLSFETDEKFIKI